MISIHAPRTGSDQIINNGKEPLTISIHAPRTGSDGFTMLLLFARHISIHAPRTGSDQNIGLRVCSRLYFNPRSPHGERRN